MPCNNVLRLPRKFGSHVSNRSSDAGWSDSAVAQWPQKDSGERYSPQAALYRERCSDSTCRREIDKIVRCLPDKEKQNFASLSRSRYYANRGQNLPGPAPDSVLRVLQISSKSLHFRWSYIRTREHRQSALESESNIRLKSSFAPNDKQRIVLFCAVVIGCFMSRDYKPPARWSDSRVHGHSLSFWATVCKTVRPMLSDCCLSCLSVCPVCPVQSVTFVHCGQTVGRIKMKLGM